MSDFLLVILVVFLLFSVFRRYIFMAVMNSLSRKLFDQAQKQQRGYQNQSMNQPPEGSVKVDSTTKPNGKRREDGEYVDFEEVKD